MPWQKGRKLGASCREKGEQAVGYTIDIDVGGTFTDGFVVSGNRVESVKVDTTPHDLTVCLMKLVGETAKRFGVRPQDLLRHTEVFRYSTTIATNAIIQRKGPRLGLLVSKGFEESLYDEKRSAHLKSFLARDMVKGITGEVSNKGAIVRPIDKNEVIDSVEHLLDAGARAIVVVLKNSSHNPANEKAVKDAIYASYPRHYLGAVPVITASDITPRHGDYERLCTAVIDTFLHQELIKHLYKADDELSKGGYLKPLLVVHSTGGVARVAKTNALNTYNSGPAAGMLGAAQVARMLGLSEVVSIDIGGTSTDIGVISRGRFAYDKTGDIEGCPVQTRMIRVPTLGGGGGSVAKVQEKKLSVGPESVGALPGPACYDLGGTQATVTDANVVLGFLNPDYFLGGRRRLVAESARVAISENVAQPLGQSLEQAAAGIRKVLAENIARSISQELGRWGLDPRKFVLLANGGAGPLHSCEVAECLGIPKVVVFPHSAVFCAFGASTTDVTHIYETFASVQLRDGKSAMLSHFEAFNGIVENLQRRAVLDMRGEGFRAADISYLLEMEMTTSDESPGIDVMSPFMQLRSPGDVDALCRAFEASYIEGTGDRTHMGGIQIAIFRLIASVPMPHVAFTAAPAGSSRINKQALKGTRQVIWDGSQVAAGLYDRAFLHSGNVLNGPAIIESEDTTCMVPTRWKCSIDGYRNAILEKV